MDGVDEVLAQWRRERPDLDMSPVGVVGRVSRLSRLLESGLRKNFARHGLDASSYDVLATLRRSGAPYQITPGALTRTAMLTSGAITQRLDRLEEAGLVTRTRSRSDGRGVVVTLSDAGLRVLEHVLPTHLETERELLTGLSEQEQAELAALLRKLLATLERPGRAPE